MHMRRPDDRLTVGEAGREARGARLYGRSAVVFQEGR